jgi:tetratricopeptide (TPR) repeat protein
VRGEPLDRDKKQMADHLPLEEVMIAAIDGISSPENWLKAETDDSPELPPVLIEEDRGYSLLGNHRTVWHLKSIGRTMVKCLVVRSTVHVRPAHSLISNCTEEAMLFEALLRREIVSNRSRLAEMLGYSRARITQLLNLLKLPLEIRQKVLITDDVSEFQLRQLLTVVDDEPRLLAGFTKLMEKKLSGRQMALFAKSDQPGSEISALDADETDILSSLESFENTMNSTADSIAELESVFLEETKADTPVHLEKKQKAAAAVPLPPVSDKPVPKAEVPARKLTMAEIVREIGSLRDKGWQTRASEHNLSPLDMQFLEGVSSLRSGLYAKAMDILDEVVSDDSTYHPAWFYLGRCANLTGQLQQSEEYLRNAVARSPENPDYLVELAIVLEKLRRHSEAEVFYRKSAIIRKRMAAEK